jgi:hypothetical protein
MELRYFQIIVPLVCLLLIWRQIRAYQQAKSSIYEASLITVFWISVSVFAFFPDFFSEKIAQLFGIKDNINAIIFFALGLLFYFQFQLYKILKRQDENLTEIARKVALKDAENPKK